MIPDDIKQKIELHVKNNYNTVNDGHFETLQDLRENAEVDVWYGYSLAQQEIERLKGLIEQLYALRDTNIASCQKIFEQFKKDNQL